MRLKLLLITAIALAALSCDRDEPKREVVSPPSPAAAETPSSSTDHPPLPPSSQLPAAPARSSSDILTSDGRLRVGSLSFQLPDGWTAEPASGMRYATLKVPGITGTTSSGMSAGMPAGFSVMRLGGMGGGMQANINRWRTQLGLTEASGDQLLTGTETIDAANTQITLVDLAGTSSRILGAIIPLKEEVWFIKLQVDSPASADPLKPQLKTMLQSARAAE